jgi:hypothetical protein
LFACGKHQNQKAKWQNQKAKWQNQKANGYVADRIPDQGQEFTHPADCVPLFHHD